jgi:hypothetical protein
LDSKEHNKSKSQIIHFPFISNITIASAKDAAQLRSPTLGCGLDDESGHNGQQDTETQLEIQIGKRRMKSDMQVTNYQRNKWINVLDNI